MKTFKELRENSSASADNWHKQNAAAGLDAEVNKVVSRLSADSAKKVRQAVENDRKNRQVAKNELDQREAIRNKAFIGDRKLIDYDPISGSRVYGDDEAVRSDNLDKQRLRSAEIASEWRAENELFADLNRQDWYASQPQNMTPEERFQRGVESSRRSADRLKNRERDRIDREYNKLFPDVEPPAYLEPMWKKLNQ